MASHPKTKPSADQYLAIDRDSPVRNEYCAGEIFAMTGASRRHNLISMNAGAEFHRQLAETSCEVYSSDMRVRAAAEMYAYPDVVVVGGDPLFEDDELDTLINPTLIIEVLSKSTEGYDRGAKFEYYHGISSLAEVLLIAQDKIHVEDYVRQPNNTWLLSETRDAEGEIVLPSISCRLPVANVYRKVRLEQRRA